MHGYKIKVVGQEGPRIDPWGTPLKQKHGDDNRENQSINFLVVVTTAGLLKTTVDL